MHDITFGEMLLEHYIQPMGISQRKLSRDTGISLTKINRIVNNKVALNLQDSIKISRYLGLSDLNLHGIQTECLYRIFLKKDNRGK